MKTERRWFTLESGEIRAKNTGSPDGVRHFRGSAAVFNQPTELWGFWELVEPTAFDRAVRGEDDVRLLFNHNPDHVLGRSRKGGGTLKLSADARELVCEADLPDTQVARDLAAAAVASARTLYSRSASAARSSSWHASSASPGLTAAPTPCASPCRSRSHARPARGNARSRTCAATARG